MAYTAAANQYLADLLTGIGQGFLSAPRNGPPLAGLGIGLSNANALMQQRQMQAQQDLRDQLLRSQLEQQQKAQAEADATKKAQQKAFSQLLPTQGGNANGYRATGAGPGASASVPPASGGSPTFAALPQDIQSYITARGAYDPAGALDVFGQYALNPPQPPKPPALEEFPNANGTAYKGYRKPDGSVVRVTADYPRWDPSSGKDNSVRFGLNPVYAKGPDGQMHMVLPNDQGGVKVVDLPPGFVIAPQTQMVNTGTAQVPIDKRTGEQVAGAEPLPIDNTGKANQTDIGKAMAQAQQSLPALSDAVANATTQIAAIKNDPNLDWATGWTGGVLTKIPGTSWKSLQTRIEQLKGTSFLQARQLLKGGGQITDYEGAQADRALNRLDNAQNSKDFIEALDEFQTAINQGLARMQYAAQGNFQQGGADQFPMQTQPNTAVPPPPDGFQVVQ